VLHFEPVKIATYTLLALIFLYIPYRWITEREAGREARLQGLANAWAARALDEVEQGRSGLEALRLAIAAAQLHPTPQTHRALLSSTSNRVPPGRTFDVAGSTSIGGIAISANGQRLALTAIMERCQKPSGLPLRYKFSILQQESWWLADCKPEQDRGRAT